MTTGPFTIPADVPSTSFQILTLANGLVEPDKTLTVTLQLGGRLHGRRPAVGDHDHPVERPCPSSASPARRPCSRASRPRSPSPPTRRRVHNTQVTLSSCGARRATCVPGTDYVPFPPTVTLAAGQTTATTTITTKTSSTVKPDRLIVVSLASVGGVHGRAGEHRDGHHRRHQRQRGDPRRHHHRGRPAGPRGQPAQFTIGLDRALTEELQVSVGYGGQRGGRVRLQPGRWHAHRPAGPDRRCRSPIPTLDNGRVAARPGARASPVQPSAGYVVGDPSAAADPHRVVDAAEDQHPRRARGRRPGRWRGVHHRGRPAAGEGHLGAVHGHRHRAAGQGHRSR